MAPISFRCSAIVAEFEFPFHWMENMDAQLLKAVFESMTDKELAETTSLVNAATQARCDAGKISGTEQHTNRTQRLNE